MEKKGISPLIATVLLIGFTIVLAAVVIRWGGDFINETTETTTCESDLATVCATQMNFEIISANATTKKIQVRNNADYAIDSFTVVINDATGSTLETEEITTGAPAFEQVELSVAYSGFAAGQTVDVIPTVTTSDASCSGACADNRVTATVV